MTDHNDQINDAIRAAAGKRRVNAQPPMPRPNRVMGAALRRAAGLATDEDLEVLDDDQEDDQ